MIFKYELVIEAEIVTSTIAKYKLKKFDNIHGLILYQCRVVAATIAHGKNKYRPTLIHLVQPTWLQNLQLIPKVKNLCKNIQKDGINH